jgi:hypothetical protein
MPRIQTVSNVDPARWNETVQDCHGTIFHAAEWGAYTRREQPSSVPTYYTLVDDRDEVAAVALGFRAISSRRMVAPFSGRRWLDALPAVRDGTLATTLEMLRLIERHARDTGDVSLHVGSFASPASESILAPNGFTLARRIEFELDLTMEETDLWEKIDRRRRQKIKKAMKSGVVVRELPASEGAQHLRRLQAASFERISARGGPTLSNRISRQEDPIEPLIRAGFGRVIGGFIGDVCVSASFFSVFNGLAYQTLSGHDTKALETEAPSLGLWEALLGFRSEGITHMNLGGCGIDAAEESSPEHGVYAYKKAFGGAQLACTSGGKILRPLINRVIRTLRRSAS